MGQPFRVQAPASERHIWVDWQVPTGLEPAEIGYENGQELYLAYGQTDLSFDAPATIVPRNRGTLVGDMIWTTGSLKICTERFGLALGQRFPDRVALAPVHTAQLAHLVDQPLYKLCVRKGAAGDGIWSAGRGQSFYFRMDPEHREWLDTSSFDVECK